MVDSFDPHISYQYVGHARDVPGYISRSVVFDSNIGRKKEISTPIKTINAKHLNKRTLPLISSLQGTKILEVPTYIYRQKTWEVIDNLIEGVLNDTSTFLKILDLHPNIYDHLSDSYVVSSVVFSRNPFKERIYVNNRGVVARHPAMNKDHFEIFLHNLYSYSRGIILVPDIRFGNIPKLGPIIQPNEYIEAISFFAEVLYYKNNLPIFVPIQPGISNKSIKEIISFYKKMNYSNIWINFNAGEVYGKNLAGIRAILRELDKNFGRDNYFIYYSHMKKELSPNIKDLQVPSSDMLSQFLNGDVIGANREPIRMMSDQKDNYFEERGFSSKEEYQEALKLHKTRVFNPETYYYHTISDRYHPTFERYTLEDLINSKDINSIMDNYIKFREVENLKGLYESEKKIKNHLKEKRMFVDNNNIFSEIISSQGTTSRSLFDFD